MRILQIKRSAWLLIAMFASSLPLASQSAELELSDATPGYWIDGQGTPKGAVVALHGLNNKPQVMRGLAEGLAGRGYHVLIYSLAGHRKRSSERVTAEAWLDDLREAYSKARRERPGLAISFVGFSLGALVEVAFLDRYPDLPVRGLGLFAPPMEIKAAASALQFLTPLANLGVSLPSLSPRKIRHRAWTPLTAYAALFDLRRRVAKANPARFAKSRALVVLGDNDALVDSGKVRSWILERRLESWSVVSGPRSAKFGHLLVGEREISSPAFQGILSSLDGLFSGSP